MILYIYDQYEHFDQWSEEARTDPPLRVMGPHQVRASSRPARAAAGEELGLGAAARDAAGGGGGVKVRQCEGNGTGGGGGRVGVGR